MFYKVGTTPSTEIIGLPQVSSVGNVFSDDLEKRPPFFCFHKINSGHLSLNITSIRSSIVIVCISSRFQVRTTYILPTTYISGTYSGDNPPLPKHPPHPVIYSKLRTKDGSF